MRKPGRDRIHRLLAATLLAGLVGCAPSTAPAPPAPAPPAPAPAAPAQPGTASTVPAAGHVALTGAVRNPAPDLTVERLRTRPQQTVTVTFGTSKGTETHVETGVPLLALLEEAGLSTDPGRKHDSANFAIVAVGADGYSAAVSYGELDPHAGNRQVLVALTEDGVALSRPRLVVAGDVKGGRYVRDLIRLHVVRVAAD